jgi:hypothetical protein
VVAAPKLRIVVERYVAERAIVENVWAVEPWPYRVFGQHARTKEPADDGFR